MWLDIKNKKIRLKKSKIKKRQNKTTNKYMKEMLYEVRCLKSNEDMILATFAGAILSKRPTTNVTEENLLTYVMQSLNHGSRVLNYNS